MVFEHRDARHAKIYILIERSTSLSKNSDLDSVFEERSNDSFFVDKSKETKRVDLVEIKEADEIGSEPDNDSGSEIGSECKIVVAMPKEHVDINDGDRNVSDDTNFVGVATEKENEVEAKYYQRNKSRNVCTVNVVLLVEERFECGETFLVPYWDHIKEYRVDQAKKETDVDCSSIQHIQPLVTYPGHQSDQIGFHAHGNNP